MASIGAAIHVESMWAYHSTWRLSWPEALLKMVLSKSRLMPAWRMKSIVLVVAYPREKAYSNVTSVAPPSPMLAEKRYLACAFVWHVRRPATKNKQPLPVMTAREVKIVS
jgi:hypothetical protein